MRWIVGGVLAGWAGIVWLAYVLAARRIQLCGNNHDDVWRACVIRTTATRDAVLTGGLTVALAGLAGLALLAHLRGWRLNLRDPGRAGANRAQPYRMK